MKTTEQKWIESEEFKTIRQFSELLINSTRELKLAKRDFSDEGLDELLNEKHQFTTIIKKAWLERNTNV